MYTIQPSLTSAIASQVQSVTATSLLRGVTRPICQMAACAPTLCPTWSVHVFCWHGAPQILLGAVEGESLVARSRASVGVLQGAYNPCTTSSMLL
jgi:hypothetical protein